MTLRRVSSEGGSGFSVTRHIPLSQLRLQLPSRWPLSALPLRLWHYQSHILSKLWRSSACVFPCNAVFEPIDIGMAADACLRLCVVS